MSNNSQFVGKYGTLAYTLNISGQREVEYIQGVIKDMDNSFVTIIQYIPYSDYLLGKNPNGIERKLSLNSVNFQVGVWK